MITSDLQEKLNTFRSEGQNIMYEYWLSADSKEQESEFFKKYFNGVNNLLNILDSGLVREQIITNLFTLPFGNMSGSIRLSKELDKLDAFNAKYKFANKEKFNLEDFYDYTFGIYYEYSKYMIENGIDSLNKHWYDESIFKYASNLFGVMQLDELISVVKFKKLVVPEVAEVVQIINNIQKTGLNKISELYYSLTSLIGEYDERIKTIDFKIIDKTDSVVDYDEVFYSKIFDLMRDLIVSFDDDMKNRLYINPVEASENDLLVSYNTRIEILRKILAINILQLIISHKNNISNVNVLK